MAGAGSAALFLASVVVPPLGMLAAMVSPLPVAWAGLCRGPQGAALALAASVVPVLLVAGPGGAAVFVAQFGLPGAALGLSEARRWPAHVSVGMYAALAVAATALVLGVGGWLDGRSPAEWVTRTVEEARSMLAAALDTADQDPQVRLAMQQMLDRTASFLLRMFPGLFAGVTVFTGWANGVALRRIVPDAGRPDWTRWSAPESCIWVFLGAGFLGLLGGGWASTAGWNVFLALSAVYFLQGLAVIEHVFRARGVPGLFRAVTYALVFLQLPLTALVAALGAFDLWFDFRSRWAPPAAHGGKA